MNDTVFVTEWYVVPEAGAASIPAPLASARQVKRPALLDAATAGQGWAWAQRLPARLVERVDHVNAVGLPSALVALPCPASRAPGSARTSTPVVLRMPPIVLRAMSLAAAVTGRDERDVWTEAAREWLARHLEDEPEPPTPGACAPRPRAEHDTRLRAWAAIDVLLRDLRAPLTATEDEPAA